MIIPGKGFPLIFVLKTCRLIFSKVRQNQVSLAPRAAARMIRFQVISSFVANLATFFVPEAHANPAVQALEEAKALMAQPESAREDVLQSLNRAFSLANQESSLQTPILREIEGYLILNANPRPESSDPDSKIKSELSQLLLREGSSEYKKRSVLALAEAFFGITQASDNVSIKLYSIERIIRGAHHPDSVFVELSDPLKASVYALRAKLSLVAAFVSNKEDIDVVVANLNSAKEFKGSLSSAEFLEIDAYLEIALSLKNGRDYKKLSELSQTAMLNALGDLSQGYARLIDISLNVENYVSQLPASLERQSKLLERIRNEQRWASKRNLRWLNANLSRFYRDEQVVPSYRLYFGPRVYEHESEKLFEEAVLLLESKPTQAQAQAAYKNLKSAINLAPNSIDIRTAGKFEGFKEIASFWLGSEDTQSQKVSHATLEQLDTILRDPLITEVGRDFIATSIAVTAGMTRSLPKDWDKYGRFLSGLKSYPTVPDAFLARLRFLHAKSAFGSGNGQFTSETTLKDVEKWGQFLNPSEQASLLGMEIIELYRLCGSDLLEQTGFKTIHEKFRTLPVRLKLKDMDEDLRADVLLIEEIAFLSQLVSKEPRLDRNLIRSDMIKRVTSKRAQLDQLSTLSTDQRSVAFSNADRLLEFLQQSIHFEYRPPFISYVHRIKIAKKSKNLEGNLRDRPSATSLPQAQPAPSQAAIQALILASEPVKLSTESAQAQLVTAKRLLQQQLNQILASEPVGLSTESAQAQLVTAKRLLQQQLNQQALEQLTSAHEKRWANPSQVDGSDPLLAQISGYQVIAMNRMGILPWGRNQSGLTGTDDFWRDQINALDDFIFNSSLAPDTQDEIAQILSGLKLKHQPPHLNLSAALAARILSRGIHLEGLPQFWKILLEQERDRLPVLPKQGSSDVQMSSGSSSFLQNGIELLRAQKNFEAFIHLSRACQSRSREVGFQELGSDQINDRIRVYLVIAENRLGKLSWGGKRYRGSETNWSQQIQILDNSIFYPDQVGQPKPFSILHQFQGQSKLLSETLIAAALIYNTESPLLFKDYLTKIEDDYRVPAFWEGFLKNPPVEVSFANMDRIQNQAYIPQIQSSPKNVRALPVVQAVNPFSLMPNQQASLEIRCAQLTAENSRLKLLTGNYEDQIRLLKAECEEFRSKSRGPSPVLELQSIVQSSPSNSSLQSAFAALPALEILAQNSPIEPKTKN